MSKHEGGWAQGTPSWVDLSVDDLDQAIAFYGELFGWDCQKGAPETGFYTRCLADGLDAAGIGTKMEGMGDVPSLWMTYLAVDDADKTAAAVTTAGGALAAEPFDVMQYGRMAICLDTNQAAFGLWQGYEMSGAAVVNQPGALTWNENMSRDYNAAKAFYTDVFGYGVEEMGGDGFHYAGLTLGGKAVAGVGELPAAAPADVPAMWTTYFSTADTDATVAKATELGGSVVTEATDSAFGRMATLRGPEGEVFAVIDSNDLGQSS
jgi:predicted enzyme related to lactoylglutathione lyase